MKIILEIKDQEIEVTLDEARKLYLELFDLVGRDEKSFPHPIYPYREWTFPYTSYTAAENPTKIQY